MKKALITLSTYFVLFISQITASPAANYPQAIEIHLCLNGVAPLSCQKYQVVVVSSESKINIRTTPYARTYTQAGVKINTSGYSLRNCPTNAKGYCLFSVSDQTPAEFTIIS